MRLKNYKLFEKKVFNLTSTESSKTIESQYLKKNMNPFHKESGSVRIVNWTVQDLDLDLLHVKQMLYQLS